MFKCIYVCVYISTYLYILTKKDENKNNSVEERIK